IGSSSSSGAAYVFQRSGSIWTQQAKLFPNQGTQNFGQALALRGDMALIGDPGGSGTGTAYLFLRSGGTWLGLTSLLAYDGESNEGPAFGNAVAITDTDILIGAPFEDWVPGTSDNRGSLYQFPLPLACTVNLSLSAAPNTLTVTPTISTSELG